MIVISHRGNISGPDKKNENHPDQIKKAHNLGFDVEIDVWWDSGKFILGHDNPEYEIPESFLKEQYLWCHAKNIDALNKMITLGAHCFWHQEDDFTLTSRGYIWTYPRKILTKKSICVMPELSKYRKEEFNLAFGVCTDFPRRYKK